MERFNFQVIEKNGKIKSYHLNYIVNLKKFYCLEMFPYPSEKFIWDM